MEEMEGVKESEREMRMEVVRENRMTWTERDQRESQSSLPSSPQPASVFTVSLYSFTMILSLSIQSPFSLNLSSLFHWFH